MRRAPVLLLVALLVSGVAAFKLRDDSYTVDVVMPAATNLVNGSLVQINGAKAGKVKSLQVRDGKAVVQVELSDDYAPLHDGTTAKIAWKATLGERILELSPGPQANAKLPDGAMVEGTVSRVELDQVLAALDAPTRASLRTTIARLSATLDGSEKDLNATLTSAGPAVQALGEVLQAVGNDGPAIRSLVTRLHSLTSVVSASRSDLSGSIRSLASATDVIASRQESLQQVLHELPSTLDAADRTLAKVPSTVAAATPLLDDLKPAADKLPAVARQLGPVLVDLRPAVAELKPTLAALDVLLGRTPTLLSGLDAVVPQLGAAGQSLSPMLSYLRPYTPELAGWLSNWGSAAANYDSNSHYLRAFAQEGTTSLNHNPGILPPGVTQHLNRLPGEAEGQPWVDANGSGLR